MNTLKIMRMFFDVVFDIFAIGGFVAILLSFSKKMSRKEFNNVDLLEDAQKIIDEREVLKSKNFLMYKVSRKTLARIKQDTIEHMFYDSNANKLYIIEKKS